MSNKTALEIAVDDLQESVNRMRSMPKTDYISGAHDAKVHVIKSLKELIEKEKQQIMHAYDSGNACRFILTSEEYYNGQYEKK